MHVVLIHGMGRTPASMWLLGHRLRRAGYSTSSFGYLVTTETLDAIVERFRRHVRREVESHGAAEYGIIGHSLGGLVTRLASLELPTGFKAFIMLAPPNRSPVIARRLRGNPLFRLLTRDVGRRLASRELFEDAPVPEVPTLVVAGTRGPRSNWLPFGGDPNDGILRLEETRLKGAERYEINGVHTFLMNRGDVFETLHRFFLDHGLTPRGGRLGLHAEPGHLVE